MTYEPTPSAVSTRRQGLRPTRRVVPLVVVLVVLVCAFGAPRPTRAAAERPVPEVGYRIEVSVDLDGGRYTGREWVRYRNRGPRSIDQLYFNLYPNVGAKEHEEHLVCVTEVATEGQTVEHREDGSGLRVKLERPVPPHSEIELRLDFEGRAAERAPDEVDLPAHVTDQVAIVLDSTSARYRNGRDTSVASDRAMLLSNPFPVLSVSGDDRWNDRTATGNVAFTHPAAYRIAVRAPEGVEVVASGRRVAADGNDEAATVFEGEALRSVGLFVARGFTERRAKAGDVDLRGVFRPHHAKNADRALETFAAAVTAYTEVYGPAPFDEMALVEAPLPPGVAGLSFSGMIAVASAYFTDIRGEEGADLPGFIRDEPDLMEGELESTVLYEAAGQWWGEAVGIDPQRSAFLREALLGYSAILGVERLRGTDAVDKSVELRFRTPYRVYRMFGGRDENANRETGDYRNYFAYAAIVQTKSGLAMLDLRERLGVEVFHAALREFYAANVGEVGTREEFLDAVAPSSRRVTRQRIARALKRWNEQRHGDQDIGGPEYAVSVAPEQANTEEIKRDPQHRSYFERFGRFIFRKLTQVGKAAAKPF